MVRGEAWYHKGRAKICSVAWRQKNSAKIWGGGGSCAVLRSRGQGWGLALTFTGHTVSSKPEARSAGAQEAAHSVMAGVVADSPLLRSPALVYICGRAHCLASAMDPFLLPSQSSKDWQGSPAVLTESTPAPEHKM